MRSTLSVLVPLMLVAACQNSSGTPEASAAPATVDRLQGAWQLVESTTASTGAVVGNRPALRLFVDGHFSLVRESGTASRPPSPDTTGNAAAFRAAWGPFEAQSGVYEIVGDTLITRPAVEKNSALMVPGTFRRSTYRIVGDTLWVTIVANQSGPISDPGTDKFVRAR